MPKKSATLRSLVSAYLDVQCTVLIEAEPALRGREPVIHSTRVAARRLRSTLRTYPETADHDRAVALSTELVWFAGLLGDVRDREVLEERLLTNLATLPPDLVIGPVAAQIETELTTGRKAAWDVVIDTLDTDRSRLLLADLHRWRSDPPLTSDADTPAGKATTYVKRATRKLDKRLGAPCRPASPATRTPITCSIRPAKPANGAATPSNWLCPCSVRKPPRSSTTAKLCRTCSVSTRTVSWPRSSSAAKGSVSAAAPDITGSPGDCCTAASSPGRAPSVTS